jgi:hypothetical protein
MLAGLRRGELMALRVEDVDLKAGRLCVERSYDPAAQEFRPPESRQGRRNVPISSTLAPYLRPLVLAMAHVRAEGVGVDVRGDAHARVQVATGVQRHALEPRGKPCGVGALLDRPRRERTPLARTEQQPVTPIRSRLTVPQSCVRGSSAITRFRTATSVSR